MPTLLSDASVMEDRWDGGRFNLLLSQLSDLHLEEVNILKSELASSRKSMQKVSIADFADRIESKQCNSSASVSITDPFNDYVPRSEQKDSYRFQTSSIGLGTDGFVTQQGSTLNGREKDPTFSSHTDRNNLTVCFTESQAAEEATSKIKKMGAKGSRAKNEKKKVKKQSLANGLLPLVLRTRNRKSLSPLMRKIQNPSQLRWDGSKDLKWLVMRPGFETFFGCIILVNAFTLGVEMQYHGIDAGYNLGYVGSNSSARDTWPWAETAFDTSEWCFGILFILEAVLKAIGMKQAYCMDYWNAIDVIICGCWCVERVGPYLVASGSKLPVKSQVFRIVRLSKLLRLLKLVRQIERFDSLYLMTTACRESFSILAWSVVLLFVVQMAIALFLIQVLHDTYLDDESKSLKERQEVYEYFGTFSRAMLSMFEMSLGNWPPVVRLLGERVSEWYIPFGIFFKLTIGFAVVGVLNGVLMQETFKVAATDDMIMLRQKQRAAQVHCEKMKLLFEAADMDGNGSIDFEEFREVVNDPHIRNWLSSMGLRPGDALTLFELIDADADGVITCEELVIGVESLKGEARAIDVATIKSHTLKLKGMFDTMRSSGTSIFRPTATDIPTSNYRSSASELRPERSSAFSVSPESLGDSNSSTLYKYKASSVFVSNSGKHLESAQRSKEIIPI